MNALLVQGLLALRPTLADSLPLSPVKMVYSTVNTSCLNFLVP
jgi:hypothetical protein